MPNPEARPARTGGAKPSAEDVARTARLARLALAPDELAELAPQFARILDAFEALRALDVDGVEPMTRPIELATVLRADEPGPCLARERALALAPASQDPFYLVPKTVDSEG